MPPAVSVCGQREEESSVSHPWPPADQRRELDRRISFGGQLGEEEEPLISFAVLFKDKIQHVFLLTFSWLILASYSLANGPSRLARHTQVGKLTR